MDAPQFTYDPERGIEAVQPTAVLAVLQEVHFKEDAYLVGISRWRQRVIFAERLPFSAGLYLSGSGTFEIKWNKPAISSEATW
jgi:hypothetical protein